MSNNLTLDIAKFNTVQKTSYVTTKELAKVLDVGESTVKRAVEQLRPLLGELKKNNYGVYLFTEKTSHTY